MRLTPRRAAVVIATAAMSITGIDRVALPAQNAPIATPRPTPTPEIDPAADLALAESLLVVKGDLPVFRRQPGVPSSFPTSWELANARNSAGGFNDVRDAELKRCLGFDDNTITTAKTDGKRFVGNLSNGVASFAMTTRTVEQARQVVTERAGALGSCLEKVHTQVLRDDLRPGAESFLKVLSRAFGVKLTLEQLDVLSRTSEIPVDNLGAHASVRVGVVSQVIAKVQGPATPPPDATQARLRAMHRGPTSGRGNAPAYFDIAVMQINRAVVVIVFLSGTGTNLDIQRFVMASVGLHMNGIVLPAV